jgi:hypothetical protein
MRSKANWCWLSIGLALGGAGVWFFTVNMPWARAGNDRHGEYIMTTGPVSVGLVGPDLDGVWLLDYKAGKLLATVVNRATGKISGWAEVDLVNEFNIPPRQDVHFLMTTGVVAKGQTALYLAETATGKIGVYTMSVIEGPQPTITVRKHDMVLFRQPRAAGG